MTREESKPYTPDEVGDAHFTCRHNRDRLLATAQAAAEADSLRAQLEEAWKETARIMEIGKQFERDCRATFAQSCDNLHRAEKAEAALTAAQGEVAVLREAAEAYFNAPITKLRAIHDAMEAALASTRATAAAHDERVRQEERARIAADLRELAGKRIVWFREIDEMAQQPDMLNIAADRVDGNISDNNRLAEAAAPRAALAHPTKEPSTDTKEKPK